jgi:tRNA pseudouridine55 synthase
VKDGLLLIDKEPGCTSHDVVQTARRVLRQKKIGHCGTLDPEATGLLLLTLGKATRLTRFLIRAPKVYEGVVRFGIVTDTYDAAGQVVETLPCDDLDPQRIAEAMAGFEGTMEQRTPPFSAKKIDGKKLYELARKGQEVPESSKTVTIFEFSPLPGGDQMEGLGQAFRLGCSSGTYARSLAHDLGRALGCGGHLARLRRTRIGPFRVDDAVTVGELGQPGDREIEPVSAWIPFDRIQLPFDEIVVDEQQSRRIGHGQTVLVRHLDCEEGDWVKIVDRRQRFVAVGSVVERIGTSGAGVVQPKIVFR